MPPRQPDDLTGAETADDVEPAEYPTVDVQDFSGGAHANV